MRTTVDIPDALYRRLRSRAAAEGRSTRSLILQAIGDAFDKKTPRSRHKVKLPLVRSKHPRSLRLDNARIYDVIGFP